MAARTIAATDTIEDLRTTFNALSEQDFGDIGTLDAGLSATSVIGAVNEIYAVTLATAGFTISDGSNTQGIGSGETLTVSGTSGEIEAVVSATDTLTIGLPSVVTITTSVTAGTLTAAAGSITDSSGAISFDNENLTTTGSITSNTFVFGGSAGLTTLVDSNPSSNRTITFPDATTTMVGTNTTDTLTNKTLTSPTINSPTITTPSFTGDLSLGSTSTIVFEGSSTDANDTTLTVANPTANRTITLPNVTGTVITTGDTGTITAGMLASDSVTAAKIAAGAVDTSELATDSVTAAKIAAGAVGASEIANGSITSTEFSSATTLLIKNSSGTTLKTMYSPGS